MKKGIEKLRVWCKTGGTRTKDNKGFIVLIPIGAVVTVIVVVCYFLFACGDACTCGALSCGCTGCTNCFSSCAECSSNSPCTSCCGSCCDNCYCGTLT